MKYLLAIFFSVLIPLSGAFAQSGERGVPFINNFTPKEYNANTQNWAVVQDERGVMYFGNNSGVLEYDGVSWRVIPVSNNSIVRSLAIDSTGTIYVGAVGEFGYLAPDSTGKLRYLSLVNKVKGSEPAFSDVWSTLAKGEEVYFHTRDLLFRYKNGQIRSWTLNNSYHRSFLVYDKLYLRQDDQGLMVMEGDSLVKVSEGSLFLKEAVSAMFPYKGKILIGTRSQGLFLFDPVLKKVHPFLIKENKILQESLIYHGIGLANGNIAFATIKDGIIVLDSEGKSVVHIHEGAGLQQNLIFNLYSDKNGTLWAALAKGISKIEIISPIQVFDEVLGLKGGIVAVTRHKGTLYIATHQGVFYLNKHSHFEKVKGLDAQCFEFEKFDVPSEASEQKLLVACNSGVYEVEKDKVTPLIEGVAYYLQTSRTFSDRVFIGFDGSLGSIRYVNQQWVKEGKQKIVNDAFRSIKEDKAGNLWMGTMFAGVYTLKVKEWEEFVSGRKESVLDDLKAYNTSDDLPTLNHNFFFWAREELVVTTQKGIYKFNPAKNAFEKESNLNKAFKQDRWLYYLEEDEKGNLWFDSKQGKGVLLKKEEGYILAESPFKFIKVSPENEVGGYSDEEGCFWFGTPDGLFRFDNQQRSVKNEDFQALIRKVVLGEDSVLFHGSYPKALAADEQKGTAVGSLNEPAWFQTSLPYTSNSLSFQFAAPAYQLEGSNSYSHFLEGYDTNWSGWSEGTKKEYTNLPEGNYTFKVKAKNFSDTESLPASFAFTVLPPWYRTRQAYALYVLAFLLAYVGGSRLYGRKLKKNNLRLETLVQKRTAEIHEQKEKIEKQKNEIERSYKNVTTLSQLGQDITATLDFKGIIQTLYVSINTLMEVSSFGVGVFEAAGKSLNFKCAFEDGEELPPFSVQLSRTDDLAAWSFRNRKEVFINDLEKEYPAYLPELPLKPPAGDCLSQSLIYVPLNIKEKIIGVITVQNFDKHAYQPYHLDILRTLAAYTAIALDNSYAYLQVNEINEELSATLTHLKHTQAQLVQSEKMASLGQLTAGVAHEINNPINFVSAGIDSLTANYNELNELLKKFSCLKAGEDNTVLLQEVERLKKEIELDYLLEEIPQLLKGIKTGATRTTEIVKSLKNFTRLDENDLKLANLHVGLDSTLVILRNQLSEKVKIVKDYDEALPPVHCYPGQLNQVFMNILNNAIQAIEGEGKIYISTRLQQEHVLIWIKDTGKGMSQEVMSRIFEPFFTTKGVGEGTGLGLSISYGILEKHKGNITVNSAPGNGTEFTIQLPINLS